MIYEVQSYENYPNISNLYTRGTKIFSKKVPNLLLTQMALSVFMNLIKGNHIPDYINTSIIIPISKPNKDSIIQILDQLLHCLHALLNY